MQPRERNPLQTLSISTESALGFLWRKHILQRNKLNGDLIRVSLAMAILCLLLVGARLRGQEKADMTVHVKVVNVPATVRDKHGKIVNNLTKDDFVLEEDGRPQTLHYFSQES